MQLSHPNLPKKAGRDPGQSLLPLQPPVAALQQNSTFSLKEVKKLFKTGGHDFDRVIPAQVRQQLSKDCAGGQRIGYNSIKQLVTQYVTKE